MRTGGDDVEVSSPEQPSQLVQVVEEGFRGVSLLLMSIDARLQEVVKLLGGADETEADS